MKAKSSAHKPFIVPIFIPHAGCPHRCVYCNQATITGVHPPMMVEEIRSRVEAFLKYKTERRSFVQIAFFGGNFLGLHADDINGLLTEAAEIVKEGHANSIRFSTRPDTIDHGQLAMIKNFPVATIELGVQSMNDNILMHANRGHTAADTVNAIRLLKEADYEIGVQMMIGLPADSFERSMASARQITEMRPDFIRLYPTVVLAGSPLAARYRKGEYTPLGLEEAVTRVKEMYRLFRKENIPVIRMGLQATDDLEDGAAILAGPYHPAFGHLVYSEIFLYMAIGEIESKKLNTDSISIRVNPMNVSKMRGLRNRNVHILKKKFDFKSVAVIPDEVIEADRLTVTGLA